MSIYDADEKDEDASDERTMLEARTKQSMERSLLDRLRLRVASKNPSNLAISAAEEAE